MSRVPCPFCGNPDPQSRNVQEHTGADGPFLSYQLWCTGCERIIGSSCSPKDIVFTTEPETVREKKTRTPRTPATPQRSLFND